MFGKCKVCEEKEKRISSLESEIQFLRNLTHRPVNNAVIPASDSELNDIFNQNQLPSTHLQDLELLTDEELREREALLTGNY